MEEQMVQPFDVNNEDDVSQRWDEWITRLERHERLSIFFGGVGLERLFKDIGDEKEEYDAIKAKLDTHFKSKFNVKLNILHFRDIYQHQGEPFEEFVTRLKEKAKLCAFTNPNSEVAIQIIHRCQSNTLKRKALESEKDLSLDELIKIGKLEETVNVQLSEFKKRNEMTKERNESLVLAVKNWFMPMVTLLMCGMSLAFTVDTGAQVNIMDEKSYDRLKFKPKLYKSNTRLYGYGNSKCIDTLGAFKTRVLYNGQHRSIHFTVTKGNCGNLLSYQ
ncbi:Retrovirus-related Pol poly from transposon [Brachionus plicatilis]|uniref:Retrovirus-related Pol poly from transposon n=1 Tax=Brachionus plicatilis TaxID=10195 RepID=A0A3M7SKH8_BRAPC|nr:Retrovirus-related Pol poly from transposon [Brachionus plicatilis]